MLLLLVMAYRLLREFRQASTRLDTPPFSLSHHPSSAIALSRLAPVAAVHGPACSPAIWAMTTRLRTICRDVEEIRSVRRDPFDAAARYRKEI